MFKKKIKPLSVVISKDDSVVTINAFFKDVEEAANKYGVDHYVVCVDYIAVDAEGQRQSWLTKSQRGSPLVVVQILAWAYGSARALVDAAIDKSKQHGFQNK